MGLLGGVSVRRPSWEKVRLRWPFDTNNEADDDEDDDDDVDEVL